MKYNTLYYTRHIIDKGETNTEGKVIARMAATGRPNIIQRTYCYGKGAGRDSACYFIKRPTCFVGLDQVPMSRSRRVKLDWTQQEETSKCIKE